MKRIKLYVIIRSMIEFDTRSVHHKAKRLVQFVHDNYRRRDYGKKGKVKK